MKIINLDNIQVHKFYLGEMLYKYQFKNEDKQYYIESLKLLNSRFDNRDKLLKIFENILKKQNLSVKLLKNDIIGLFNFFNYILL